MATTKFYLTSNKPNAMVYIRFSAGRKIELRRKTGVLIPNPTEDWSEPKQMPKTNNTENKNLNTKLKELSISVLKKYNKDFNNEIVNSIIINGEWLGNCIDLFFHRVETNENDYFLAYAKGFVVNLSTTPFIYKGIKRPYKQLTIDKYNNIVKHFEAFEKYSSKKYKILEITNEVTEKFATYLSEVKELSINSIGRDIKRIKTIILDAEKKGFKISHKVKEIRGFEDEKIIVSLSFEEIEKIKEAKLTSEKLERARNWLIIGCFTGQRISDLWRMKKAMIIKEGAYQYISFTQYKTGKKVKIPIHWEVEEILKNNNNDFPNNFSANEKSNRTELGNLMKEVCRIAGINEITEARYNGKKGLYEKYKLISNHTCRRSFCSNFYGNQLFTTPMLMEITGHVKEVNFLKYIGEEDFRFSERTAIGFEKMKEQIAKQKKEEKNKLKVV